MERWNTAFSSIVVPHRLRGFLCYTTSEPPDTFDNLNTLTGLEREKPRKKKENNQEHSRAC